MNVKVFARCSTSSRVNGVSITIGPSRTAARFNAAINVNATTCSAPADLSLTTLPLSSTMSNPNWSLITRPEYAGSVVPKELWPLVDQPVIQYIITEAKKSGIEQIIFVLSPENKKILDYLKPSPTIEKILKQRKKQDILDEFKQFEETVRDISFDYVLQKKPLGDGHAILQAEKLVKDEPVICLFADDIVDSKTPCPLQLINVFKAFCSTNA